MLIVGTLQVVEVGDDHRAEGGAHHLEAHALGERAAIERVGQRVIERVPPQTVVRKPELGLRVIDLALCDPP